MTPQMARKLMQKLESEGVQYVVAPYEADAQMAYLNRTGYADIVISEDSDCIPFGCSVVFFKLDRFGNGEVIDSRTLSKRTYGSSSTSSVSLARFTEGMILDMCILSGCDYLPSMPGMGVKRAHHYVYKFKKTDRILRGIRFDASHAWPKNYEKDFKKARLCFRHQRVYCPKTKRLVHLNPIPEGLAGRSLDFLGPSIDADKAEGIATGRLHPSLHTPWAQFQTTRIESSSIAGVTSQSSMLSYVQKLKSQTSPFQPAREVGNISSKEKKVPENPSRFFGAEPKDAPQLRKAVRRPAYARSSRHVSAAFKPLPPPRSSYQGAVSAPLRYNENSSGESNSTANTLSAASSSTIARAKRKNPFRSFAANDTAAACSSDPTRASSSSSALSVTRNPYKYPNINFGAAKKRKQNDSSRPQRLSPHRASSNRTSNSFARFAYK